MDKIKELAEKIEGIMYDNISDAADEGSWIDNKDFHKVADKIAAALASTTDAGKEERSIQDEHFKLAQIEEDLREFFTKNREGKGSGYAIRVLKSLMQHPVTEAGDNN